VVTVEQTLVVAVAVMVTTDFLVEVDQELL
jgi:hypothetical protein